MSGRCFLPAEKNSLPGDSLLFQTASKNLLMYRRKLGFMCQVCQMSSLEYYYAGPDAVYRTAFLPARNVRFRAWKKSM